MKERKFVRLKVNMEVSYRKIIDDGEDTPTTYDISEDGLCLTLPERLSIDRQIELELKVPKEKPIVVRGRVVWTRGDGSNKSFVTGVQFVEIDEDSRKRLMKYADTHSIQG